jgi:hypothetical protein
MIRGLLGRSLVVVACRFAEQYAEFLDPLSRKRKENQMDRFIVMEFDRNKDIEC